MYQVITSQRQVRSTHLTPGKARKALRDYANSTNDSAATVEYNGQVMFKVCVRKSNSRASALRA